MGAVEAGSKRARNGRSACRSTAADAETTAEEIWAHASAKQTSVALEQVVLSHFDSSGAMAPWDETTPTMKDSPLRSTTLAYFALFVAVRVVVSVANDLPW